MQSYVEVWAPNGPELVPLGGFRVTLGRAPTNDIVLGFDPAVSRLHAVLEPYPSGWCVRDVGSSNGTFVNGHRILAEHGLRAGDEIHVGNSRLVFRAVHSTELPPTVGVEAPPTLTRREREVLVALCRPMGSGQAFSEPASIRQIADRLVVTEGAVKFHFANLYGKFRIAEGRESRRVQLANEAVRRRAISLSELRDLPG